MSKIQSVKNHFRNNKVTYVACGVTAVVVAGVTYCVVGKPSISIVGIKAFQGIAYKSPQTIEVFVEALGDPGNIIQDLATGTIYASQGQAARELGLNAPDISKHLAGLTNHVKGHRFVKLGKAMVAEAPAA